MRGIKLSSAMVAAGLVAAHSSGGHSNHRHQRKYGVITLIDCRRFLEPPLSTHHFGTFYFGFLNKTLIFNYLFPF